MSLIDLPKLATLYMVVAMDARDLKFLNAFNCIPGVGPATMHAIRDYFKSFEDAWRASDTSLQDARIRPQTLRTISERRSAINPDREMGELIRHNVWLITDDDPGFPSILKEIPKPPIAIYGRGAPLTTQTQDIDMASSIGIVGTRRPTAYGLEVTEKLVQDLVAARQIIVSGLALGIDGRAHQSAIEAGGHTIAVLGSGINDHAIFPPEHRGLASRIVDAGGSVISEYAPGTPAVKEHFPQRNRIISGLARGIVVVEARERSGALITARFALEQNREVFAVPNSIFSPHAAGPNKLIQDGARLVTSAEDILNELGISYTTEQRVTNDAPLGNDETTILHLLEEPVSIDELKIKTNLETSRIVSTLSMLELKGMTRKLGPDTYQKT